MRKLFIACLGLVWASVAGAGEAGRIVFVAGQAQLASKPALLDAAVQEGDAISTGADGYIYIKTVDQGYLILRPNSKARIAAYHIDSANPANTRVKLELLSGVARAISGQGVKAARHNFRFNTPVAAIGVRGTDFVVFTDQQTSRVSVFAGGVVMAGFGEGCSAEGGGPCEGGASRELFAGQAGLLQVQRGQNVPQLLNNPSLSPDQTEKPRMDEPVGKASTALGASQVNLDPQRIDLSQLVVRQNNTPTGGGDPGTAGGAGSSNGGGTAPVPVLPPAEVAPPAPKVQEVFWGRWTALAGKAQMPDSFAGKNLDEASFLDGYAIARVKGAPLVMPTEGTIGFKLVSSDALMQRANGVATAAKVDSGTLGINFVDRTFNTALVVSDATIALNVNGRGVISDKGVIINDGASPTLIRGFLSGAQAEEAAYIFKNSSHPGITVTGATTWKK